MPGAGAVEAELAKQITQYSETCPGLDQYAIQKFAQVTKSKQNLERSLINHGS